MLNTAKMTPAAEMAKTWRSTDGRFAVRIVHLNAGWRYWAFERDTGYDVEIGLRGDGHGSMDEAIAATKGAR